MAPDVRLQYGGRALAEGWFENLCTLYDQVFSQPPFRWVDEESHAHRELLMRLKDEPTFGIVTAEAAAQLVGFGYGYQLRPDTHWWDDFLEPVPEEVAREWPGRTFALIDLAVDAAWRGRGLGRQVIEVLLANRTENRAALTVQPAAVDTQAFYRHLGWQLVGRHPMPPDAISPFFDVYVIELRSQP